MNKPFTALNLLYERRIEMMRDAMDKGMDKQEARQEHVNEQTEDFITQLLGNLDWDDLDYNRSEVKDMIKKALK